MAVYLTKYKDEQPQLGTIKSLDQKTVTLAWYAGCYSGKGKVCMIGGGRSRQEWREVVPREVVQCEIKFTRTMKLPKETVTKLKDLYSQFNQ